jgi:hypothetical protein
MVFWKRGARMKIHHVLGPLTVILFANTASGQEDATRNPLALAWGERVEKWAELTLDEKLLLSARNARKGEAGTAIAQARVQSEDWKSRPYLADRGDGIHTSIFGTYVRKSELLVYLFYEYTRNRDAEYKPSELGFGPDSRDFKAKREDHETLIFLAYGITDSLAVEVESALYTSASQNKARNDASLMPQTFRESGVGDTEAQIRYRWFEETEVRPELISFFEVVFPLQKDKKMIGTQDWELTLGTNLTKGFPWGTFMLKAAAGYSDGERKFEFTDWGIEYVKRLTDRWRVVLAIDGVQTDEIEAVAEIQWQLRPNITIKLNSGFGLTPKAPEYAPEVGILFAF